MIVICNIYKSIRDLLPHFYEHYKNYGVRKFLFGICDGDQNPVWEEILETIPPSLSVKLVKSYDGPINGVLEGNSLNKLRTLCNHKWVIPTDLDEFHVPHTFSSFVELRNACVVENAVYVETHLHDQITADGTIPPHILPDIPILSQFSKYHNITGQILKACELKISLSRADLPLNDGHHFIGVGTEGNMSYRKFSKQCITHHFKWFGDLYTKEMDKWKIYSEIGASYASENDKLLTYMKNNGGKLL